MLACCGAQEHPWNRYSVEKDWLPTSIRCLIVGENPGSDNSEYFYNPPRSYARDRVVVRKGLLRGLADVGLVATASLEGFRDAGFLFDHGIRWSATSRHREARASPCETIRVDAGRCRDPSPAAPVEGRDRLGQGHIASNAVVNATAHFPKERRMISQSPYPGESGPGSRFFVSEYFTRWNRRVVPEICAAFARFAGARLA